MGSVTADRSTPRPSASWPGAAAAPGLFEHLYLVERGGLLGLGLALTGRLDVAEDLVQETFMRAHRHWDHVAVLDRPGAWLRRVLINLATSRGRRLVVEARGLALMGHRREGQQELPEDSSDFWRLVRGLPRRQSQVVALYYFEDRSTASVAEILGVAEGTVRALLAQARATLAHRLSLDNEETPHE